MSSHTSSASLLTRPYEYMAGFDITIKTHYGAAAYVLQMYSYNKVPLPRLYLRKVPAEMYPPKAMHMRVYGY